MREQIGDRVLYFFSNGHFWSGIASPMEAQWRGWVVRAFVREGVVTYDVPHTG